MKTYLILAITICFMLEGCLQTEGTIDLKGKVFDECTKMCIPNRKVVIQGLVYEYTELITKEAGQFRTDSTGHFSYSFKKTKGAYRYNFIFVGDSTYFTSFQNVFLTQLVKNSRFLSFPLRKLTGGSEEMSDR